jgi:hypothetical protein
MLSGETKESEMSEFIDGWFHKNIEKYALDEAGESYRTMRMARTSNNLEALRRLEKDITKAGIELITSTG